LTRTSESFLSVANRYDIPVEICADPRVPIESSAIDELLRVLELEDTLRALSRAGDPRIVRVVGTPDFHKGAGIPIGTALQTSGALIPQAVGNDINCGMRVEWTSLTVDEVRPRLDALERRLRHLFFEGGRLIGLTANHREGLLRSGIPGLLDAGVPAGSDGVWSEVRPDDHEFHGRMHASAYPAATAAEFADWITSGGGLSYDGIIGSVGGGNHFAELQYVSAVHDKAVAYEWGLSVGRVVTMVHSGSLSVGHQANATGLDQARALWPASLPRPANAILPILWDEPSTARRERYLTVLANAANFALGNRFLLAMMLRAGLRQAVGDLSARLVYDAPHNLLWPGTDATVVHRKGATPAALAPDGRGEPVIVPGSMGAPSYLLRGLGNPRTLHSASHGAGRRIPRGTAARGSDADLDAFLREFRVVTPLDPRDPTVASRRDVIQAWRRDLKQEAPWAYKDVVPVIDTLREARVADPVVELRPLMTVKE
jgi:tRNA-splicing ligase RtcB